MRRYMTFETGEKSAHLEISYAHPNVISGGHNGRIRRIAPLLSTPEIIESDRGLVTVHGTYKGIPITAFCTGMGPSSVAITLPEVIEACHDDNMIIVRAGTAGALQKNLNVGDLVITDRVERRETLSYEIASWEHSELCADKNVMQALMTNANLLKREFQHVSSGHTRTVQELYLNAMRAQKEDHGDAQAVSMEFSIYCALRELYNKVQKRNIQVGELFLISDAPVKNEGAIDMGEYLTMKLELEEIHLRTCLETIVSLRSTAL